MTEDQDVNIEKKEPEEVKEAPKKEEKKKNIILIVIVLLVIAALIGVIIILLNRKPEVQVIDNTQDTERPALIDETNVREFLDSATQEDPAPAAAVDATTYTVTMNTGWQFENGDAYCSNAYIANLENENTTPVYFDVVMAENEEDVLFQSPVLPLGAVMTGDQIKLARHLDAGVYEAVCIYHLIDDAQNTLSTVRVKLTLTIKN